MQRGGALTVADGRTLIWKRIWGDCVAEGRRVRQERTEACEAWRAVAVKCASIAKFREMSGFPLKMILRFSTY